MKADYDELSEHGRAQARALGEYFSGREERFDAVWSGPARRHHDTAALAAEALGAGPQPWPERRELPQIDEHDAFSLVKAAGTALADDPEVAQGQRELLASRSPADRSRTFQRVFEAVMHRWMQGTFEPEGVETWPQFRDRVRAGLDAMITSGARRPIAFSSVGPVAVMLQRALGTSDADSFRTAWRLRNTGLTTFVFDGQGRFTLDRYNELPHLSDPEHWTFR